LNKKLQTFYQFSAGLLPTGGFEACFEPSALLSQAAVHQLALLLLKHLHSTGECRGVLHHVGASEVSLKVGHPSGATRACNQAAKTM